MSTVNTHYAPSYGPGRSGGGGGGKRGRDGNDREKPQDKIEVISAEALGPAGYLRLILLGLLSGAKLGPRPVLYTTSKLGVKTALSINDSMRKVDGWVRGIMATRYDNCNHLTEAFIHVSHLIAQNGMFDQLVTIVANYLMTDAATAINADSSDDDNGDDDH